MSDPILTIAIPTFHRPNLLKIALRSAISQDCSFEYEILVVDNDPSPESKQIIAEIIQSLPGREVVYSQNDVNIGMVNNWNKCLELATGKYVTILSDDDALGSRYASTMVPIAERVHADLLRAGYIKIEGNTEALPEIGGRGPGSILITRYWPIDFIRKNPVGAPVGVHMLTNPLRDAGIQFKESAYPSFDYDVWSHMVVNGLACFSIGETLGYYRYSVNDSLRKSTIVRFIARDRKIRKDLSKTSLGLRVWCSLFDGLLVSFQIIAAATAYKTDISCLFGHTRLRHAYYLVYRAILRKSSRILKWTKKRRGARFVMNDISPS